MLGAISLSSRTLRKTRCWQRARSARSSAARRSGLKQSQKGFSDKYVVSSSSPAPPVSASSSSSRLRLSSVFDLATCLMTSSIALRQVLLLSKQPSSSVCSASSR